MRRTDVSVGRKKRIRWHRLVEQSPRNSEGERERAKEDPRRTIDVKTRLMRAADDETLSLL